MKQDLFDESDFIADLDEFIFPPDIDDSEETALVIDFDHIASRSAQAKKPCLISLTGNEIGQIHPLTSSLLIGRSSTTDLHLPGNAVSREHCRVYLSSSCVIIEDLKSSNGTYLNGHRIDKEVLMDGDRIQIGRDNVLKFTYVDELEEEYVRKMKNLAIRDALTKAYSRSYLTDRLEKEMRFALRHRSPLSLLLFDLDYFKSINDTYGHLAGDCLLTYFAKTVQESIRSEDVFARYGGEEFILLTRDFAGSYIANRLRQKVAEQSFNYNGHCIKITASVGVASIPQVQQITSSTQFIAAADRALYSAKSKGRNCVINFNPSVHQIPVES
jgi:diguanylate cyclase (GGDEF)-like protein